MDDLDEFLRSLGIGPGNAKPDPVADDEGLGLPPGRVPGGGDLIGVWAIAGAPDPLWLRRAARSLRGRGLSAAVSRDDEEGKRLGTVPYWVLLVDEERVEEGHQFFGVYMERARQRAARREYRPKPKMQAALRQRYPPPKNDEELYASVCAIIAWLEGVRDYMGERLGRGPD
jgi:hypothetical protein